MHQDLIDNVDTIFHSDNSLEIKRKELKALCDSFMNDEEDENGFNQTFVEINQYWDELKSKHTIKKAPVVYVAPNSNIWEKSKTFERLHRGDKGKIMTDTKNLFDILTQHPDFKNTLRYNDFSFQLFYKNQEIRDTDYTEIRYDICEKLKLNFTLQDVTNLVNLVAKKNKFHPVQDYLKSLKWDKVDRMEQFVNLLHVESSKLNNELLTKWLIACVARIMDPGCKVDSVPILHGATGTRKSSAVRALVPDGDWHTSEHINFGTKDSKQLLIGKWIVELPELSSISGKETNLVKADITLTADEFRLPYERKVQKFKRQFVYIGTTNDDEFMQDPTSNRRFWVFMNQGVIDTDTIEAIRDQLWAQAMHLYLAGERWYLDKEQEAEMSAFAGNFEVKDAWYSTIVDYLDDQNDFKKTITTNKILTFLKPNIAQQENKDKYRVQKVMNFLKWKNTSVRIDGKVMQGWKRPDLENVIGKNLAEPISDWNE